MSAPTPVEPNRPAPASAVPQQEPRVASGTPLAQVGLAALAFIAAYFVPVDFDYWWHLANGRYILAYHRLPASDPFSFTASGQPLVAHEWLGEIAMYLLHRPFGVRGPDTLYSLCMAGVAVLTFNTLRRTGVGLRQAALLVIALIAAVWAFTGPRPQVASFLLLTAVLWLLERWMAERDHSIWALPALLWVWGNLHGSFAIGFAVVALILVTEVGALRLGWRSATRLTGREQLKLASALAIAALLLLLNPNGLALLAYPFSKLNDPLARQLIAEWMPVDLSSPLFWPFALLAGGYVAVVALRRPHLPLADILLTLAMTGAALSTRKYVPYASITLAVLTGRALAQPNRGFAAGRVGWPARLRRPRKPSVHGRTMTPARPVITALMLVALAASLGLIVTRADPLAATRQRLPVAAVDTLGADGLKQPLFNDYNWGGYLIWRLWPRERVFIDGRGDDLYTRGGVLREYGQVVRLQIQPEAVLNHYGIQSVLVPKDTALTRYLLVDGGWRTTYDDGRVVVLERALR